MKNKVICLLLVIMASFITLTCIKKDDKDDSVVFHERETTGKSNLLSMNLEQTAGAGDYKQVTQSSWPTDGYKLNDELSRCEKGSTLSWDDTKKTVIFSGNTSDKCYVYFDKIVSYISDICKNRNNLATCVKNLSTNGDSDITGLYYHNSTLINGAKDNSYRYSGASNQVNNFICFGSTASSCPIDNLYRIIGVIDDKVKLIKYDYANSNLLGTKGDYVGSTTKGTYYKGNFKSINTYYWNYKADTTVNDGSGSNTWSTSLLNKTNLNTNFLSNIGTTWSNKIATTTWKVGGNIYANIASVIPSIAYQNEIINPVTTNSTDNTTEYVAKIGLMYVSDYGFAASPESWTQVMTSYTEMINNNWMFMGMTEWTISRRAESTNQTLNVFNSGSVYISSAKSSYALRPVFNLISTTTYKSGSGTQSDPILIN